MIFDNSTMKSVTDINIALFKLSFNKNLHEITIGPLKLDFLSELLEGLKGIKHIQKIIITAAATLASVSSFDTEYTLHSSSIDEAETATGEDIDFALIPENNPDSDPVISKTNSILTQKTSIKEITEAEDCVSELIGFINDNPSYIFVINYQDLLHKDRLLPYLKSTRSLLHFGDAAKEIICTACEESSELVFNEGVVVNVEIQLPQKRQLTDHPSSVVPEQKLQRPENQIDTSKDSTENSQMLDFSNFKHSSCGKAALLHQALCQCDDENIQKILDALPEKERQKILLTLCHEEKIKGATVLRLALYAFAQPNSSISKFGIITTLIKYGADLFQRSADQQNILHDIILLKRHNFLLSILEYVSANGMLERFVNTPYRGGQYNKYFPLDVICVEIYSIMEKCSPKDVIYQKFKVGSMFNIIKILIKSHAQSVLLSFKNEHVFTIINVNSEGNYTNEEIWQLIKSIHLAHQLLNEKVSALSSGFKDDPVSFSSLANLWRTVGVLPLIARPVIPAAVETQSNAVDDQQAALVLSSLTK